MIQQLIDHWLHGYLLLPIWLVSCAWDWGPFRSWWRFGGRDLPRTPPQPACGEQFGSPLWAPAIGLHGGVAYLFGMWFDQQLGARARVLLIRHRSFGHWLRTASSAFR